MMLPLLKYSADKAEHSSKEAVAILADIFQLSEEERKRLLPNGRKPLFYDRVHWALSYLKGADLLTSTRFGHFRITDRGVKVLNERPQRIDNKFLKQFPEFLDFIGTSKEKKIDAGIVGIADQKGGAPETDTALDRTGKTPEEVLEENYLAMRKDLARAINRGKKLVSGIFREACRRITCQNGLWRFNR